MVPFKTFFAKTFLILQHCTFESSMLDSKPVRLCTARMMTFSKLLHCHRKDGWQLASPSRFAFFFFAFFLFSSSFFPLRNILLFFSIFLLQYLSPFLCFPRPGYPDYYIVDFKTYTAVRFCTLRRFCKYININRHQNTVCDSTRSSFPTPKLISMHAWESMLGWAETGRPIHF